MAGAPIILWQWNCRGFKQKRRALELTIQDSQEKPDVLALQEIGIAAKLTGYATYTEVLRCGRSPTTALMVHRNLTAIQIDLECDEVAYTFIEILPNKRADQSLFVLNLYSPPKDKSPSASKLMINAYKHAHKAPLVVLGDFNARHSAWGYPKGENKGNKIWETAQGYGFTLLNDPERPTRIGNSVSRNTSPDLAFVKNIAKTTWENTEMNVGSDHYILTITAFLKGYRKRKLTILHTR